MTNSLKMLKLDLRTMQSQRYYFLSLIACILFFCYGGSSIFLIGVNIAWFTALSSSSIFAIQEKDGLERLYGSVSIKMENIVSGRYLFILINYVATFLMGIAVYFGYSLFQNNPLHLRDVWVSFGLSYFVFSVIIGLMLPLFFKKGYTKARALFMLIVLGVLGLILIPFSIPAVARLLQPLLMKQMTLVILGIVLGSMMLHRSYRVSVKMYRNRE